MVSQFSGMDIWDAIQIIGLILSFVYLILEFRQKASMWIISALSSVIYACVYFNSKIYADMAFCCFNIILCIYGFYKWYKHKLYSSSLVIFSVLFSASVFSVVSTSTCGHFILIYSSFKSSISAFSTFSNSYLGLMNLLSALP